RYRNVTGVQTCALPIYDFCGDSYFFSEKDDGFICVIADGLGSGETAGESSQAVVDIIKNNVNISDEALVKKCVQKLSRKRGSVRSEERRVGQECGRGW